MMTKQMRAKDIAEITKVIMSLIVERKPLVMEETFFVALALSCLEAVITCEEGLIAANKIAEKMQEGLSLEEMKEIFIENIFEVIH